MKIAYPAVNVGSNPTLIAIHLARWHLGLRPLYGEIVQMDRTTYLSIL